MLNKEPLESRLRRYLSERDAERTPIGLEVRIVRKVKEQPTISAASTWPRQLLAFAAFSALVLGLAGGIAYLRYHSAPTPARQPGPTINRQTGLTPAEQAELAVLEARPLNLPPMPAGTHCSSGPMSNVKAYKNATLYIYGSGPVYDAFAYLGGLETDSADARYFDAQVVTDPTARGVVLIRGQELGERRLVTFVGPYATGPVVGSDTIAGQKVDLHTEAVLPVSHPPANTAIAPGWVTWPLREGFSNSLTGCIGFQVDTASGTKFFVAG